MSADLLVSRAVMGTTRVDLHRHATFTCAVRRALRRISRMFS